MTDFFPVQTERTSNIFYMANTFQIWKELQANFIEPKTCGRLRVHVDIQQEFIVTFHNFRQFEKGEYNKLVRAEIKARKYVLGQQRKSASNEQGF